MSRTQTATMRKVLHDAEKCELCGSRRCLEAHHIIPVSVGGPDSIDNMIVVCGSCHAKLTPKSVLTKMALQKRLRNGNANLDFYRRVIVSDCQTVSEVLEVYNKWFIKHFPDISYTSKAREAIEMLLDTEEDYDEYQT